MSKQVEEGGNNLKKMMRDSEKTRRTILAAAFTEFSEKGLSGARVDDIIARTHITKPMLYYHFGSKEQLYAAVIDYAYSGLREIERALKLDDLPPEDGLRRLVEASFDHHAANPDYVRLICVENIERARHIVGQKTIVRKNAIALQMLRSLIERGEKDGTFRKGVDPMDLHLLISSFCFFRISNKHTWKAIFEKEIWTDEQTERQKKMIADSVLLYMKAGA